MSRRRKVRERDTIFTEFTDRKCFSIVEAHLNLVCAVREQAIKDHKLKEFEDTWLKDPTMSCLLYSLLGHYREKSMMLGSGSKHEQQRSQCE